MMLQQKIVDDIKAAMRAKDAVRLRTLRSLRAALLDKEIAERKDGEAQLSEAQAQAVVQKQAKQRRDAITQYDDAGRDDLAAKEREELAIIAEYLPQQLSDEELRTVLEGIIARTGAGSMRDMGRVMGAAMPEVRGRADGKRVQQLVRQLLS